ncbi:MAG: sel1 repeat family protein, partial [Burkholderiaceae bacterium]|nr:sel1 repeat family protein [Burkholderiaceae bacterium]
MRLSIKKTMKRAAVAGITMMVAAVLSGCESSEKVIERLLLEVDKGDSSAMLSIAELYCGGQNIEQDDLTCGIWLKMASEHGQARAQYMLGVMYEKGIGMRADPVEAYRWYSLSAGQGIAMAVEALRNLEGALLPVQI